MEGDWLSLIPKPCSGLTPDLSCPLAAGTTTCSHPTQTPARTPEGSPAAHRLREGPGASWEGGRPLLPRRRQEVRKEFGAGEACGPLVSLPASTLLPSPEAGQAGVSGSHRSDSWTSEGEGWQKRPFLTKTGWLGSEFGPPSPGGEEVAPGIRVVFCRPFPSKATRSHFPWWGLGSSGALGTLQEEGPGAGCTGRGRACIPPVLLGLHTQFPTLLSLCQLPGQGAGLTSSCGRSGLCASEGSCAHRSQSPCFVLLVAVLQQWDASKKRGCSLRPPPP